MERHASSEPTVKSELVLAELQRILESESFQRSRRMQRFLAFVVEETLAGRADQLGEYSLGVSVFDRGVDFEPALDPIVRNDARRLRFKLNEYYRQQQQSGLEGSGIRIDIPKGAYVPVFAAEAAVATQASPAAETQRRIAVLPFEILPESAEGEFLGKGLRLSVTAALTGIEDVEAVASGFLKERQTAAADLGLSHMVEGSVLRCGDRYRVFVTLARVADGAQIWALSQDFDSTRVFAAQRAIAEIVAKEVTSRLSVRRAVRPRLALVA